MDPHERTRRFPIIHNVSLSKPRGRAMVMGFAGKILVYPWIWGRQPTAKVLLALVTYEVVSAYKPPNSNIDRLRTFEFVDLVYQFLHQN
jgi:hypothetical protein